MGVSRSASVIVAYLIRKNNWNPEKALAKLKRKHPIAKPNLGFLYQL